MHIAAIYIFAGSLPHIFGLDHAEITINLGGRNLYKLTEGRISEVEPNPYYLEDIVNDGISVFSCLVGNNGGGKTTLMKYLTSDTIYTYVLESTADIYEVVDNLQAVHRIYYTPYLNRDSFDNVGDNGKDLSKLNLIKIDNHGDGALLDDFLSAHFSENMKRWIRFNHFFRRQTNIKVSLPNFTKITLRLMHFDFSIHARNGFHNTADQLRPILRMIMGKIEQEQTLEEQALVDRYDPRDHGNRIHFYPVKFKYQLYEAALGKLVNIFERRGNIYLQEGIAPDDYEQQITGLDVRESLIWFLNNCGVYNGPRYLFNEHRILIELIDYILALRSEMRVTESWLEMEVDESEAFHIINLYDRFNEGFNNGWFHFDTKPMFSFRPHISVSSGEQSFLDLFSTMFYHASNMRLGIKVDTHSFEPFEYLGDRVLLLLDEGDNAFHPHWRKAYVKYLRELMPVIFEGYHVQIVITSHDALTLSDLPRNNVIFLEKIDGITRLRNPDSSRTFGASIADLLKDSFFIGDGQIGDFAANMIDKAINDIKSKDLSVNRVVQIERTIYAIDEPVIKFKLAEMLGEAVGNNKLELQLIDQEMQRLERRRREL